MINISEGLKSFKKVPHCVTIGVLPWGVLSKTEANRLVSVYKYVPRAYKYMEEEIDSHKYSSFRKKLSKMRKQRGITE